MNKPQMLYKLGTCMQWQGRAYDWLVVDASDSEALENALNDGWCEHPDDCQDMPADAPKRRGRPPKAKS